MQKLALIPDRLVAAMSSRGFNKSSLARAVGLTPSAIQQLAAGHVKRTVHLSRIAQVLGVTEAWLLGATDKSEFAFASDDVMMVSMWSLRTAPGEPLSLIAVVPFSPFLGFPEVVSDDVKKLGLFTDIGNGMIPTFLSNDRLLINFEDIKVRADNSAYLIDIAGAKSIRRVLQLSSARYRLSTDAPGEQPICLSKGEFSVSGRVVWSARAFS